MKKLFILAMALSLTSCISIMCDITTYNGDKVDRHDVVKGATVRAYRSGYISYHIKDTTIYHYGNYTIKQYFVKK